MTVYKYIDKSRKVQRAADKAAFRNFGHAAASIRKDAAASIKRAKGPSSRGQPPHTRRGRGRGALKRSIRFHATKEDAVIGSRFSIVGESGSAHEFGGRYKGDHFDERPFMGPALDRAASRFGSDWAGTIGE
jgi:phage gpG-like protein